MFNNEMTVDISGVNVNDGPVSVLYNDNVEKEFLRSAVQYSWFQWPKWTKIKQNKIPRISKTKTDSLENFMNRIPISEKDVP